MSELRVECDESVRLDLPGKVAAYFATHSLNVNTIDGARVHFKHGWVLVRALNTQPVLVRRVEAETPEMKEDYFAAAQRRAQSVDTEKPWQRRCHGFSVSTLRFKT